MARRKKEPAQVHRTAIASAAEKLFLQRGIEATTMDAIAKEAGYSKATLYVHFQSKEEILAVLTWKGMKLLQTYLTSAISAQEGTKEAYYAICETLVQFQEQHPFAFLLVLDEIQVNLDCETCFPVEKETFMIGEQINEALSQWMKNGIASGSLRSDIPILPTVFLFWASLSGLIQMAENKQTYFEQAMGISKRAFLEQGFQTLYRAIAKEDGV